MKRLLLVTPLLFVLPALAQEAPEKPASDPQPLVLHEVRLSGGTLLVGTVEPRHWKVLTKFGVLN